MDEVKKGDVEAPTPVSGAHSGSGVVERGATFPGAKAEDAS